VDDGDTAVAALDAAALERFRELLRIPTVSRAEVSETDWTAFAAFRAALDRLYPRLHALAPQLVAEHTLLLRWAGADPGLPPVVLIAHQDVVDPGDETAWTHPAFGAELTAGEVGRGAREAGGAASRARAATARTAEPSIWARGAIDDKGALVALLEAAEDLIATGFVPQRDIWLLLGHDEETHGSGAAAAAEHLAAAGIRPAFVLDEGGAVVPSIFPGLDGEFAAIGLAEKGLVSIRLAVDEPGGHASTPPPLSAIGRLARAIARVDARPFPVRLTPAARAMFRAAGQGAHGLLPWLYRNVAFTAPILTAALRRTPEGDAMTRTTRVTTVVRGGHAPNAIPEHAEAIVNVRVLPGETVVGAVEHLRRAIRDPLVELDLVQANEPSPVSPTSGPGWEAIGAALTEVFPEVRPLPYTQNGATDSRHLVGLASAVYRFSPFRMSVAERAALHAVDERIRVRAWLDGIAWYRALLRRL